MLASVVSVYQSRRGCTELNVSNFAILKLPADENLHRTKASTCQHQDRTRAHDDAPFA